MSLLALAALSSGVLVGCGDPADAATTDQDGDTISDLHEGRDEAVDTDADGVPDYRDTDSDGDGILDLVEAGDSDLSTPPPDSDSDGDLDPRDTDADDNGVPDGVDGVGDFDGDGMYDFADLDDDNDRALDVVELDGVFNPPIDSDGDGAPNYRDRDSDDDTILDGDEQGVDTDGDWLFDGEDLDSDGDGLTDAEEAGDADLDTPPVDTDGDGAADFRDTDADDDGLSDLTETRLGSSPTAADTDGDGVSDLIEVAAGTDLDDGSVSPRTRGDFVFVVPYEEAPTPSEDTLEFRTSIQFADIYFLFDISGSMDSEIEALVGAVTTVMDDLTCADFAAPCARDMDCPAGQVCSAFTGSCIEDPSMSSCVASAWTGAGYYEDGLESRLQLQGDPVRTADEMSSWSTFGSTESMFLAITDLVRDDGGSGTATGCVTEPGRIGCAGFREEAVRILVTFSDEDSDDGTLEAAASALREQNVTFIGVWSGGVMATARDDMLDLANASESFDGEGRPLVFNGQDAEVVPAVTSAINQIVEGVPLRVTLDAADEPDDAGNALVFIDSLRINGEGDACTDVELREDTDGDGFDDAFPSLLPGTPVCWDVVPAMNTTVEPTPEPQVFRARLTVRGDGSPLDTRLVYFLVPPEVPPPGGPI
ncbi:MAG: hypothetical protein AB8I08_24555 [Sandaracinaceae bacterium]